LGGEVLAVNFTNQEEYAKIKAYFKFGNAKNFTKKSEENLINKGESSSYKRKKIISA